MERSCQTCNSKNLKMLDDVSSADAVVPTSDGQYLTDVYVERVLCLDCACAQIYFVPNDRLDKYFAEEYDISDTVQNNIIVKNGSSSGKHELISDNLFSVLDKESGLGNILEVGCGGGRLLSQLHERYSQVSLVGVDPSSSTASNISHLERVEFWCELFSGTRFSDSQFDVVIAHGVLNRATPLPYLKHFSRIVKPGGIFSVEVVTLEQSIYAPYIWDHPYTYLDESFRGYLDNVGFEVLKAFDCGSSTQFICRRLEGEYSSKCVQPGFVSVTEGIYEEHIELWENAISRFDECTRKGIGKYALFGAGLYSTVFLNLIDKSKVSFLVDEIRYGNQHASGLEIVSLEESVKEDSLTVFLSVRPSYEDYLYKKLRERGIDTVRLFS